LGENGFLYFKQAKHLKIKQKSHKTQLVVDQITTALASTNRQAIEETQKKSYQINSFF